jgi:signal transduction histidine kinase
MISADRLRLEQALGNLVDNALRHGAGRVTLETVPTNGTVELHVLDQGPGLLPDFIPDAFERFSRPNEARSDDGSGLGLAIVRTIAQAHGGNAHATNKDGHGADVWISLPAVVRRATHVEGTGGHHE